MSLRHDGVGARRIRYWRAPRCRARAAAGKAAPPAAQLVLRGAGATFPAALYKKWFSEYAKVNPGIAIDYKDVGSSEGIKRFIEHARSISVRATRRFPTIRSRA